MSGSFPKNLTAYTYIYFDNYTNITEKQPTHITYTYTYTYINININNRSEDKSLLARLLRLEAYSNFDHPYRKENWPKTGPQEDSEYADAGVNDKSQAKEIVLGTFLRRNYRSHKDILELPSRLFYDSCLLKWADSALVDSLVDKWCYPGEKAPIPSAALFVGVDGMHAHEIGSPSFFNLAEAGEFMFNLM